MMGVVAEEVAADCVIGMVVYQGIAMNVVAERVVIEEEGSCRVYGGSDC